MKEKIYKIFHPSKYFAIPFCIISIIALIYVLGSNYERSIVAYITYVSSAYTLTLFIVWILKIYRKHTVKIKNTNVYKLYNQNKNQIAKFKMIISTICNLLFCIYEFVVGIYYKSWWFITFSVYYLALFIMKNIIISGLKNKKKEYKKLRFVGFNLLLLNIVLIGMLILMLKNNMSSSYSGYLIYAVALYDFVLIISAICDMVKYRKKNSPILYTSKCLNLTIAMISMLSLEVAMISTFGNNESDFKFIMTSSFGFLIVIINTIMSVSLIIKSYKKRGNK